MQLTISASQAAKDAEVVKNDTLLAELKTKKAEEVSTWVEGKTTTAADTVKLLKSLALAINHLLGS